MGVGGAVVEGRGGVVRAGGKNEGMAKGEEANGNSLFATPRSLLPTPPTDRRPRSHRVPRRPRRATNTARNVRRGRAPGEMDAASPDNPRHRGWTHRAAAPA